VQAIAEDPVKKETRTTHPRRVKLLEGNEPLVSPVYRSVKFAFPSIEDGLTPAAREQGFDYTRDANPTTRELEWLVADLQERDAAIAVASGMAAIWLALLGNLESGDRVVVFIESYRPARAAVRQFLPRFGVHFAMLSIHDRRAMAEEFARPETKLVLFEAPTNPMLQVPDIAALVELAQANGVITVLDNTFGGLHNHGQFPVDYYVHSLTKYGGGHGDVLGGAVVGDERRIRALRPLGVNMGATLDPGAAYLLLRGLKTYYVRYRRQSETALEIARFLASHPRVERVFYPGLPQDPGHALAARQMDDFGSVLSLNLRADRAETWAFIDALKLFTTTSSLGSTESLVAPVKLYWCRDLNADEIERAGITDSTVRLAVGLEHPDDLVADLKQAFEKAFHVQA
jgi:cystathionine beta-lyase/cystathionine gamma-synthase